MKNFTICLTTFLCLFLNVLFAQGTFEQRAKAIASKIETITKEEKQSLKNEIEAVNAQLEKGTITNEQAEQKKKELAEEKAKSIEIKVAEAQNELRDLVQQKVDGKISEKDSTHKFGIMYDHKKDKNSAGEHRTTSQFVFAFGLNNLTTNNAVAHSDFRYWGSHFYEVGFTYNTRILNNNNLLHAKYGLSLMCNNLRPTNNRIFVENGNQTQLVSSPIHLEDSRFRNVNLVVPVHLEFDFSGTKTKDGKQIFRSHESLRFGVGGYAGINVKSKQVIDYKSDDNDIRLRTKGDFNVNDFIYGISAYAGYKELSLYAKYDLNPIFSNNLVDQHDVSLGLSFDFN